MRGEIKMTNPISKAIVKAAVAMGYGKKSDYKGSSVADVLEKFAAIAKDKGGSSGGAEYATFKPSGDTWSCDKTFAELKAAYEAGKALIANIESTWIVPMIMFDYGNIQFFTATGVTVNGIPPQFDDIRIDTVKLDYFTQDGTDAVEVEHNTWTVDATVYNGA